MTPEDANAFRHLILANHFLRLAENAARRLVATGNPLTVVSGREITPDEYWRKTRWADHSIGVAILFNFYHGVELVLKGCLARHGVTSTRHKLSPLLSQFEQYHGSSPLFAALEPTIRSVDSRSPFGQFLHENGESIDNWYQSLKYPRSADGKVYTHWKLQYGSGGTVKFWRGVANHAGSIRKNAVAFMPLEPQ